MGKRSKSSELFGQEAYQQAPEKKEEEVKHVPDELPIVWGYFSEGVFMWAKPEKVGFYEVPYIPAAKVRELREDIALMRVAAAYDGGFEAAVRGVLALIDELLTETEGHD